MSKKRLPVAVFAYNFPHKKTQDFLFNLKVSNIDVRIILAAESIKLNIPEPTIRTKIRHIGVVHPREIAEAFGFPYSVVKHNSEKAVLQIKESGAALGVIAGARILKAHVIDAFPLGIVNFHPGILPEVRGLDAVLWSIFENKPLGVTAHLIDDKIDAGKLLLKKKIPLFCDDTILDITERIYETQLEILANALDMAMQKKAHPLPKGKYHKKMSPHLEQKVLSIFPKYLSLHAGCKEVL